MVKTIGSSAGREYWSFSIASPPRCSPLESPPLRLCGRLFDRLGDLLCLPSPADLLLGRLRPELSFVSRRRPLRLLLGFLLLRRDPERLPGRLPRREFPRLGLRLCGLPREFPRDCLPVDGEPLSARCLATSASLRFWRRLLGLLRPKISLFSSLSFAASEILATVASIVWRYRVVVTTVGIRSRGWHGILIRRRPPFMTMRLPSWPIVIPACTLGTYILGRWGCTHP